MPPRLHGSTATTTSVAPAQRRRTTEQRRIGGTAISVRNWTDQVRASVRLHRSDGSARHLLRGRSSVTAAPSSTGTPPKPQERKGHLYMTVRDNAHVGCARTPARWRYRTRRALFGPRRPQPWWPERFAFGGEQALHGRRADHAERRVGARVVLAIASSRAVAGRSHAPSSRPCRMRRTVTVRVTHPRSPVFPRGVGSVGCHRTTAVTLGVRSRPTSTTDVTFSGRRGRQGRWPGMGRGCRCWSPTRHA